MGTTCCTNRDKTELSDEDVLLKLMDWKRNDEVALNTLSDDHDYDSQDS